MKHVFVFSFVFQDDMLSSSIPPQLENCKTLHLLLIFRKAYVSAHGDGLSEQSRESRAGVFLCGFTINLRH